MGQGAVLDWRDSAAEGAHTSQYTDGETLGFLTFHKAYSGGGEADSVKSKVVLTPEQRALRVHGRSWDYATTLLPYTPPELITQVAVSELLPDEFIVEIAFQRQQNNSGNIIGFVSGDLDIPGWIDPHEEYGGAGVATEFKWALWHWQYGGGMTIKQKYRDLDSLLVTEDSLAPTINQIYRCFIIKNSTGYSCVVYDYNEHEFVSALTFIKKSIIANGDGNEKIVLGGGAHEWSYAGDTGLPTNCFHTRINIPYLNVSENFDADKMDEVSTVTAADGATVVPSGTAQAALTDEDESTYINIPPGGTLTLDITGAAHDFEIFGLEIVSDCDDTDTLSMECSTHAMGNVWSRDIEIGDSRSGGEKIGDSWTATKRHVYWPDFVYMLETRDFRTQTPAEYSPIGCRKIRFTNNNLVNTIKVYEIKLRPAVDQITIRDNESPKGILYQHVIDSDDAPAGETGDTQTLNFQNTSGHVLSTVKVELVDEGDAPAEAIEFSVDGGSNWETYTSQAVGGETLGTSVADQAYLPFLYRINIPAGGANSSFKAIFRFHAIT